MRECRERFHEDEKKAEEKKKASTASAAPRRYVPIQFIPRAAFFASGSKECNRSKSYDVDIQIGFLKYAEDASD